MTQPDPVIVTRVFDAPQRLVFEAFSTAEHIKQWFSPAELSTPFAEVDFRPGGVFAVCMRTPDGTAHWSRGTFVDVQPCDRIVFAVEVGDPDSPGFSAVTTIVLEAAGTGTKLTMRQAYDVHDPAMLAAVAGAPEGWRTTLDKLERLLAGLAESEPIKHGAFTLERIYPHPVERVFHALSDPQAKAKWFHGGADWTEVERSMDCRPGGRERAKGRWTSGVVTTFDAVYFDVVPNRRLVYAYDMWVNAQKLSVSLATVELSRAGAGTRIVMTEQGAFLGGYEDGGSRERGTSDLLDRIGAALGD